MTDSARSQVDVEKVEELGAGEAGGVIGNASKPKVGARYVIPMALCNPVMSAFWGRYAIVTSPIVPRGLSAGIGIRWTVDGLPSRGSSHFGNVTTFSSSKCFQALIAFADAGSARMVVFIPCPGN